MMAQRGGGQIHVRLDLTRRSPSIPRLYDEPKNR